MCQLRCSYRASEVIGKLKLWSENSFSLMQFWGIALPKHGLMCIYVMSKGRHFCLSLWRWVCLIYILVSFCNNGITKIDFLIILSYLNIEWQYHVEITCFNIFHNHIKCIVKAGKHRGKLFYNTFFPFP